jgi:hypothetical protein
MAATLPTFADAIARYKNSFIEVDTATLDRALCNMAGLFGVVRDWREPFQIELKHVDDECRRLLIEAGRLRPGDGKDIVYTREADPVPRLRHLAKDSDWDIIQETTAAVKLRRKERRGAVTASK